MIGRAIGWLLVLGAGCGGGGGPAAMLDPLDAADGCTLVGERTVCNHGHSIGFRSESLRERRLHLAARGITDIDESMLMASDRDGSLGTAMPDPLTPVLRARAGETVRLRVVSYGPELHTFHVHGHVWVDDGGRVIDNEDLLPAETLEATFTAGGGPEPASPPRGGPGDWFYHCHVEGHLHSGMWSLFRVMEDGDPDLALELDGRFPFETPPPLGADGETIDVWVVAVDAPISVTRAYSELISGLRIVRRDARLYVPVTEAEFDAADLGAIRAKVDADRFEPWVLTVAQGTRIRVHLKNLLEGGIPVSLHPHGVVYDVGDDGGTPGSIARAAGDVVDYEYVADQPGIWPYHDHASPHVNVPRGLFAAIVVTAPGEAFDRDYVVILSDMDFAWLNGLGETGGAMHMH